MLAIVEREIMDRRGPYAFCDTDSMAIGATEFGGLYECEGGTADTSDRLEAVRVLTWADVRDIQARLNALNPYDRTIIPDILNIEDVNYRDGVQRTLLAFVVSAKRYALYSMNEDRSFRIEKCSEHGLGHLLNPLPKGSAEKWPEILWIIMLSEELNIPYELPGFLKYPAISRISVSTPKYFRGFLRRWAEKPYGSRIKPYGFLIGAHVARFGHPDGVDPKQFRLLAPFTSNPKEWDQELWTDAYSGREFAITTALSYQPGVVRVRSIADVLAEFLAHGEVKSLAPNGELAERDARGLLQRRHVTPSELRLIGKESNALEAAEAGLIGDWATILSTYGDRTRTNAPTLDLLMSASAPTLAKTLNVSLRTVRRWRRKQRANGSGGE